MKRILISALVIFLIFQFSSCGSDNPVSTITPGNNNFTKVYTVDSLNYRFELYSNLGNVLYVGYNEIGFKVFVDGAEKTTGFVKYNATMKHLSGPGHATPVKNIFEYDGANKMFMGYACYIMLSDSTSFWYGDYNYNGEFEIRQRNFDVAPGTGSQMRFFLHLPTSRMYLLTLISPKLPVTGLNEYKTILHYTLNESVYYEVDSASMHIRPWMPSHGHGSSSNVDPVHTKNGIYEGKVNFNMPGMWFVYDSIKVNNDWITPSPPIYFVFDVR